MPLSGRMRKVLSDTWFAGVDGCRAGWLLALARPGDGEVHLRVVPRFAEVIAAPEAPAVIAIDIPIGLPEQAGHGGRTADDMVRPFLGARRSSVFSVPSRRAVFAEVGPFGDQQSRYAAHQRACAVARRTSDPPRSITIFAFGIFSKIREVDAVLQSDRSLHGRVRAAAAVNGGPPKGAGRDDLLDALACAAIARRIHRGLARPFPDPPERDACGLPMAIWA